MRACCRWAPVLLLAGFVRMTLAAPSDTAPAHVAVTTLQLTSQPPRGEDDPKNAGALLLRELQRQSLLIAAREELGLNMRDMALAEIFPRQEKSDTLTLLFANRVVRKERAESWVATRAADQTTAALSLDFDSPNHTMLGHTSFPLTGTHWIDYADFLEKAEQQSRNDYVDLLKKAGLGSGGQTRATPWVKGTASADALAALEPMNVFSQFVAVRMLHAQMKKEGASPERVAALIRGYANLGFLTQSLWNGAYKAFLARALLYSQRLVVHENGSAQSLYTRAYAEAMTGLHALATKDFAAAQTQDASMAPAWAPIIDAFCHFDLHAVDAVLDKDAHLQPLAELVKDTIIMDGYATEHVDQLGEDAIRDNSDSFWLMQQVWQHESLGMVARLPSQMLHRLPSSLSEHLDTLTVSKRFSNTLAGLAKASDNPPFQTINALRRQLNAAGLNGDAPGEPSLGVLSALIRDEEFVAIAYGGLYLKEYLGTDAASVAAYVQETKPGWQDHPLAAFMEAMAIDPDANFKQYKETLNKLHSRDGGSWVDLHILAHLSGAYYQDRGRAWGWPAEQHLDLIPLDYSVGLMRMLAQGRRWEWIGAVRRQSPYCATLFRGWLEAYPANQRREEQAFTDKVVDEAVRNFSGRTRAARWAARWAIEANNYERGLQLVEDLQKVDPAMDNDSLLATTNFTLHRFDKALAAVDDGLTLPSEGLNHSVLAATAAHMLMLEGQNERALSYAQKAAEPGSVYGLLTLATCQDRLNKLDEASETLHGAADRYPNETAIWYLWARRNKHPDAAVAEKDLRAYVASHPDDPFARSVLNIADSVPEKPPGKLADGKADALEDAMEWIDRAVSAGKENEKATLQGALRRAARATENADFGKRVAAIANAKDIDWELTSFDAWLAGAADHEAQFGYVASVGRLLAVLDQKPQAVRYLTRAIRMPEETEYFYNECWDALVKLGEDPVKLRVIPRTAPFDSTSWVGTWSVTSGGKIEHWTVRPDGSIASDRAPRRGRWWADDQHLLITWTPNKWDALKLPLNPSRNMADDWEGAAKVELRRQSS